MTGIEIVAVLLGLVNILLVVRRSLWNYPVGIAMVSLYGVIFWNARLYSDALLQVGFLALNVYGWVHWRKAREGEVVPVRWMGAQARLAAAGATIVGWFLWSTAMARFTDAAVPYWDGAVAAISITAQVMLARRYVENWICWIVVNLLAIGLFWTRGLELTAALYAVFLVVAIVGLVRWREASGVEAFRAPVHP